MSGHPGQSNCGAPDTSVGGVVSDNDPAARGVPWACLVRLCVIGFFVNCQPSEPYLTQYLQEDKGLTEAQLNNQVWPYDTYASLVLLLPVGILAEIVGYKQVILFGLLCRQATRLLLIFANGVPAMALMQVTYAAAIATESIYFAYVYMVVAVPHFAIGTGMTHVSVHLGNVVGSLLAQLLHNQLHTPLKNLLYLSWIFTSIGGLCFLLLPEPLREAPESLARLLLRKGAVQTLKEVRTLYASPAVRYWALWWIIGYGAALMISNYYQNQFYHFDPTGDFGLIEALMETAAAAASLVPAWCLCVSLRGTWLTIGASSVLLAAACLCAALATNVAQAYAANIMIAAIGAFQLAAASASTARHLEHTSSNARRKQVPRVEPDVEPRVRGGDDVRGAASTGLRTKQNLNNVVGDAETTEPLLVKAKKPLYNHKGMTAQSQCIGDATKPRLNHKRRVSHPQCDGAGHGGREDDDRVNAFTQQARFGLIFCCNSFVALVITTCVQQVASTRALSTSGYFYVAAAAHATVPLALTLLACCSKT